MPEVYNPDGQHKNLFDPLKITEWERERKRRKMWLRCDTRDLGGNMDRVRTPDRNERLPTKLRCFFFDDTRK